MLTMVSILSSGKWFVPTLSLPLFPDNLVCQKITDLLPGSTEKNKAKKTIKKKKTNATSTS